MLLEGNYYIARKNLQTSRFEFNYLPGLCPYELLLRLVGSAFG